MGKFQNQVVVITGAAGGIGSHLSALFAEEKAKLALIDIDPNKLKDLENRLQKFSTQIISYEVDQSQKEQVFACAKKIETELGTPDLLINNAGIGFHAPLFDTSFAEWEKLMAINFWGPLYFTYAFLPQMRKRQSGHIVHVATGQVYFRVPTWGAYTVSKTALATFSEVLRAELKKDNISVTTVYPYMVNTGFYQDIEAQSLGGELMLALLPLYSQSAEKVAEIIYKAILQKKSSELVHPLNQAARYFRLNSFLSQIFDTISFSLLNSSPKETQKEIPPYLQKINSFISKNFPKLGFQIEEVMTGEHEFEENYGPKGRFPLEFRVVWGAENIFSYLNPAGSEFLKSKLKGNITVGGLCRNVPCEGELALKYFDDQSIRYELNFTVAGKNYQYIGVKKQIYPWNLPWSHTTCFGEIWLKEEGKRISRSMVHFPMESLRDFLGSFRLVY